MMNTAKLKKGIRSFPWRNIVFLATGLLLLGWLLNTPPGLLGKADAIGYAVCHRIDVRSFHLGERQLPLCARCSGMYLGALLGLVFLALVGGRRGGLPALWIKICLGALALAFIIDGLNSFLSLVPGMPTIYQPQNWLRLATGTGMGLVVAVFLFSAFNQTVWIDWTARPALDGRKFGMLLILAVGLDALLLSNNPVILYPLALLSAATVLLILCLVYTIFGLIVAKKENLYKSIVQLGVVLVCGFGVGLLQIVFLDIIRFWMTGTWDGFHLG